jgi:hypothetical protein
VTQRYSHQFVGSGMTRALCGALASRAEDANRGGLTDCPRCRAISDRHRGDPDVRNHPSGDLRRINEEKA